MPNVTTARRFMPFPSSHVGPFGLSLAALRLAKTTLALRGKKLAGTPKASEYPTPQYSEHSPGIYTTGSGAGAMLAVLTSFQGRHL
jgi:hypothetical protein